MNSIEIQQTKQTNKIAESFFGTSLKLNDSQKLLLNSRLNFYYILKLRKINNSVGMLLRFSLSDH